MVVALLVAVAVVLGGWTMVLTHGYDAPSGPIESAVGTGPTRQQAVDAVLSDIGPPASHDEVGREHRLRSAGTVVSYLPADEAAGDRRVELLSAWVERSSVWFQAAGDVTTFLDCATQVGADGGASRCTLVGRLRDQRVEFAVSNDLGVTSCGSPSGRSGYRVELSSGSAPSGQDGPGSCGVQATAAAPEG